MCTPKTPRFFELVRVIKLVEQSFFFLTTSIFISTATRCNDRYKVQVYKQQSIHHWTVMVMITIGAYRFKDCSTS
jgi:hypothetical protein